MKEKIVFVLGAGFSKEAEAPLVDEFFKISRHIYTNQTDRLDPFDKSQFDKVFSYHDSLGRAGTRAKFDIDNIEEFFSILDMNVNLSKDLSLEETKKALIYLIIKTLDVSIEDRKYNVYTGFLDKLYSSEHDFSYISFNYDLILESILEQGSCSYNYCLDEKKHPLHPSEKKLLKLHGSSNWLLCNNPKCGQIEILNRKVLRNLYNKVCDHCRHKSSPLFIPPTWNKKLETSYLKNVWGHAFEELKKATKIAIIGYSFPETDIYFKDFLILSLRDNTSLNKIILVDPNEKVADRYRSFLNEDFQRRYFQFIKGTFSEKWNEIF